MLRNNFSQHKDTCEEGHDVETQSQTLKIFVKQASKFSIIAVDLLVLCQ